MAVKGEKKKGAGRPLGSKNRNTFDIKIMINTALKKAGGVKYLTEQAHKNPVAFLGLLGKVIPKDVSVDMSLTMNTAEELKRLKKLARNARSKS